jgi:hypothetical protein
VEYKDLENTLKRSKKELTKQKTKVVKLRDKLPVLYKVDEVRDIVDKMKVDFTEIEQVKQEIELLQQQIKFRRGKPELMAALQQEENLRELRAMVQEQKNTY